MLPAFDSKLYLGRGPLLLAVFFGVATVILAGAGFALLFPGTVLETVWLLYPARRALLMPWRAWLGPGFLALATVMLAAGIGSALRRQWGRRLAIAIFAANGAADAAQFAFGHFVEGGVGMAVAALILFYLTRPSVKAAYRG